MDGRHPETCPRGRPVRLEERRIEMNRFLLLYVGPVRLPDASHEGWPECFAKLGDGLVDRGSASQKWSHHMLIVRL